MAEGGQWSRSFLDSLSKASGDAFELFCEPCKSVGSHIAVEGFCQICEEYMCGTCLKVHRKQKITRAHVILDKQQMPSQSGSVSSQDICVEVCRTHRPEIIRFFCRAHDEPGCGDCRTINHPMCLLERVQDISQGFRGTTEFTNIDQKLQQLHQELDQMEGKLDSNLENLKSTYKGILHKIKSVRKQINDYLDQIEKTVTNQAAQMKKEDERELKTGQAENQTVKNEIEAMLQTLHNSNINLNSLFVLTKQAKHRLATMEREVKKITQIQKQKQKYEFQISKEIENIISAKTPLGQLSRKSSKESSILAKRDQKTPRTQTIDMPATYDRSIGVKSETDKVDCTTTGSALLKADRLVITDWSHKNVKLIDLTKDTVITSYRTSSTPWGVAALSTHEIAVTLPTENTIEVLEVISTRITQQERFSLQRQIKVNHPCQGIAYKDGKFAVSYRNPGRIEILADQGKLLHTIQPQGDILQVPDYITFGQNNNTVIASDYRTNKVSVFTFSGQILHTYTHDKLRNPCGIVITADGLLFVSSWWDKCIYIVSPDFKTSKIIIKDNHVVYPRSITYCNINHRLYISNTRRSGGGLCNQVQVYDWNVPI